MKKCSICQKYKSLTEFHLSKSKKDGRESRCKICRSNLNVINKEKNQKLKYSYGITLSELNEKITKQNNKCKICNKSLSELNSKDIHVDHNHITNNIRGILCKKCNSLLGLCNDNDIVLENAISYLRKYK